MSRIALIGDNSIEYISTLIDIWNSGHSAVLIDWRIPLQTSVEMMIEANVTKCYNRFILSVWRNFSSFWHFSYNGRYGF